MPSMFKSDVFKLVLVLCATLGLQIVGVVHWSDMATPNWIGATLGHLVNNIASAFGISLAIQRWREGDSGEALAGGDRVVKAVITGKEDKL